MRVLIAHNFYQQAGGEDAVFAAERDLLRSHGHDVETVTDHNDRIEGMHPVTLALGTIWSREGYRAVRAALRRSRADILHVHNTFPLLSPSVYAAARAEGVPVVQTLHNYRLVCPAGTLFRDDRVCRDCMDAVGPWPAVRFGCYQGSRLRSGGVASMLLFHRLARTWSRQVARYIVMSRFARELFIEAGLPAERLVVKPHFVAPDPGIGRGEGGYALFVGRLAPGKGLETLCRAWRRLGDLELKIAGDGPLAARVRELAAGAPNITLLGHRSRTEVAALMGSAGAVVFPSESYESFGLVVIEAFARGTPVIAARVGSTEELVSDGINGVTYAVGDVAALASCARRLLRAPTTLAALRVGARRSYEAAFTAERNYEHMIAVYEAARGVDAPSADVSGTPGGEL